MEFIGSEKSIDKSKICQWLFRILSKVFSPNDKFKTQQIKEVKIKIKKKLILDIWLILKIFLMFILNTKIS